MSSFKTNRLIFAIGALIIGIILLIWPGTSLMIIGRCIGAVLAAGGIVAAFLFWKDHEAMSRSLLLVMAAVMMICGIVILLHPDELVKLIPTIMGILAVMSGIINIGETFLLNRKKYGKWWISLLVAALKIAGGLFVIRNAFDLVAVITRVAGGVMIFSGGSDLWVLSRLVFAEKQAAAPAESAPVPGSVSVEDSVPGGREDAPAAPADAAGTDPAAAGAADAEQTGSAANAVDPAADATSTAPAPADTANAPAVPGDAVNAGTSPADEAPAPDDHAAAVRSETESAAPESVSPGLVWDDGSAGSSSEIPEYMSQEEQSGEYKEPE